ncbi:MAG: hypothetical protein OJF50_006201 [Nitrospira sp.]|nr:hypothetical protein [Nitrospira sp.]
MAKLTALQRHFLTFCADDYTGLESALRKVEKAHADASPMEQRARTLELIREMLGRGYIQAGDLPGAGESWTPWPLSTDEIIARVATEWEKLGKERSDLIDIVWFVSTTEGDRILAEDQERNVLKEPDR